MSATPPAVHVHVPQVAANAVGAAAPVRAEDPQHWTVALDDLGFTRGDGIFETIGIFEGRALALEPHLQRLQRSATMLDLPQLDLGRVREAIRLGVDAHRGAVGRAPAELLAKILLSRGPEATGDLTCWIVVSVSPDYGPARRGLAVAPLDRGTRSDVAQTSPWLLSGAKTLSYAVNMAMLREAARRGADDVLMTSSEGFALEGPTSTLVVRRDGAWLTPDPELGILPGTTQGTLFDALAAEGAEVGTARMPLDEVTGADAAWLVSSGRLVVPITRLGDVRMAVDADLTREVTETLLATTTEI